MGASPIFFSSFIKPNTDSFKFSFPSTLETLIHKSSYFSKNKIGANISQKFIMKLILAGDFRPQFYEAFVNFFIATIDLFDIVNHTFTFGRKGCKKESNTCADIRG